MTPDDFQLSDYWRQRTRGNRDDRRAIFTLTHPEDPAFGAKVILNPPRWAWSIHGRVGGAHGSAKRKRAAMWEAIKALELYYSKATP